MGEFRAAVNRKVQREVQKIGADGGSCRGKAAELSRLEVKTEGVKWAEAVCSQQN